MAIVLTDHDDVPYEKLAEHVSVVFDTRGVYRRKGIEVDNLLVL